MAIKGSLLNEPFFRFIGLFWIWAGGMAG